MKLIPALVLVTIFAAITATCLLLASKEQPALIDQVGQRIEGVTLLG